MSKWMILGLAMVATAYLLTCYLPSTYTTGIMVYGHLVPWCAGIFLTVLFLGARLKD